LRDQTVPAGRTAPPPGRFAAFDPALRGAPAALVGRDGRELPVDPVRWYAPADGDDQWLLDRCAGRTLDLGCGPGRLVVALGQRGVPALGVDCSEQAVRECRARGGTAVRQDLFETVPDEGGWAHALLADGNIGIGGDPRRLLQRVTGMVRGGGSVLVETAPGPTATAIAAGTAGLVADLWSGQARLVDGTDPGLPASWFPWAVIGARALIAIARELGLVVTDRHSGSRQFVQLTRLR
jgi:SAM-dependent methyltransferase